MPRGVVPVQQSEMPLAYQSSTVSGLLQQFRPSHRAFVQPVERLALRVQPIRQSQFAAVAAGNQARPRRRANRRDGEGVRQVSAALEEPVDARRGGVRMSRQAQRPTGLVVGIDEQDVGPIRGLDADREPQQ